MRRLVIIFLMLVFFPAITSAKVFVWFTGRAEGVVKYHLYYCPVDINHNHCNDAIDYEPEEFTPEKDRIVILGESWELDPKLKQYNVVIPKQYNEFTIFVAEVGIFGDEGPWSDPLPFRKIE